MAKEQHPIGEIITLSHEYDRTKVIVTEGDETCNGCVFVAYEGLECIGYCNGKTRTDHKNIIYKEIEEETK